MGDDDEYGDEDEDQGYSRAQEAEYDFMWGIYSYLAWRLYIPY